MRGEAEMSNIARGEAMLLTIIKNFPLQVCAHHETSNFCHLFRKPHFGSWNPVHLPTQTTINRLVVLSAEGKGRTDDVKELR